MIDDGFDWLDLTPLEQQRQLARDIVVLHAAMQELVEEHDWSTAYLVGVTGGWLNFVFSQCFSGDDFHRFIDTMINTHKGRHRHAS